MYFVYVYFYCLHLYVCDMYSHMDYNREDAVVNMMFSKCA